MSRCAVDFKNSNMRPLYPDTMHTLNVVSLAVFYVLKLKVRWTMLILIYTTHPQLLQPLRDLDNIAQGHTLVVSLLPGNPPWQPDSV